MNGEAKPGSNSPTLKKYRIALYLLLVFCAAVVVVALWRGNLSRLDNATYNSAQKTADQLNNYINKNSKIPSSLTAAGIKNVPPRISYIKYSDSSFLFCVSYRAGSGADTYNDSLRGQQSYLYVGTWHHAGNNCQSVKPQLQAQQATTTPTVPYVKNSDGSYTVCGVHTNYFDGDGHVTVDPSVYPGSLRLSAISYPYTGADQLVEISVGSQIFDWSCHKLQSSDIKDGDETNVFDIVSATGPATSILLKANQ